MDTLEYLKCNQCGRFPRCEHGVFSPNGGPSDSCSICVSKIPILALVNPILPTSAVAEWSISISFRES